MTVGTYLSALASSLVLPEQERASIAISIATLSSRLNSYFGTGMSAHFQFGSSTRGTILPREADSSSDIDYMVVFSTVDGLRKPQTYLDRLRRFAETKYSTSEIHQSHPTVVLSLNHINFELVPAVKSYWLQIPSPASDWSEWIPTDPSAANQALQDKNKANNDQIKPLVRLVKYWNAHNGHPFTSFSLEQYIVGRSFWLCSALKDYFYAFWSAFDCTFDSPQYVKELVRSAKMHAKQAKEYEDNAMPTSAEAEVKKVVPTL